MLAMTNSKNLFGDFEYLFYFSKLYSYRTTDSFVKNHMSVNNWENHRTTPKRQF